MSKSPLSRRVKLIRLPPYLLTCWCQNILLGTTEEEGHFRAYLIDKEKLTWVVMLCPLADTYGEMHMSEQAITYFNQAQMMLLDLHGSILRHLMAMQSMEDARQGNQDTVELFDGVAQRDGLRDACSAGLDRVKLKLQANIRAIETYGVLIDIAAGALLQISKQALSIAHGKRENAPAGASISSTCVRDLIWHGRNQSMHYEETRLTPLRSDSGKVIAGCSTWVETFQKLNEQNPGRFEMTPPYRSLAKDVLDALEWTYDYGKFERDMRHLLGIHTSL